MLKFRLLPLTLSVLFFIIFYSSSALAKGKYNVVGREFGPLRCDMNSWGDTWMPAWSKDGQLYTPSNDTLGFDQGCQWPSDSERGYDIAIHQLTGNPWQDGLHGSNIQCLREYNSSEAKHCGRDSCPDPVPNWKSSNIVSVNGVLYLTVFIAEPAWNLPRNASIIKSIDQGKTWCGPGAGCSWPSHDKGMFQDNQDNFGAPYFIDYGQDRGIQGDSSWPDDAKDYVYAISSNGFDTNTNDLNLGRVLRSKITRLNRSDWEVVADYTTKSGVRIPVWGPIAGKKKAILGASVGDSVGEKISWTTATWVAPIKKYLMIQYRHAHCSGDYSTGCYGENSISGIETYWQLYQADHAWGPWKTVDGEHPWSPQGLYAPFISTRWIDPKEVECEGENCHLDLWVLTSGDPLKDPQSYYHLCWLKMRLKLKQSL